MGRRKKEPPPKPVDLEAAKRAAIASALMALLFPEGYEMERCVSPGGYKYTRIKQRKEQAA
jgi:hypothetical protein